MGTKYKPTKATKATKATPTNYLLAFDALCDPDAMYDKHNTMAGKLAQPHEEGGKPGTRRSEAWRNKRIVVTESGELAQPIRVNARGVVDCRSVASVPAMGKGALDAVAHAWSKCGNIEDFEEYYGPRGIDGTLPSGQCMQQCFSTYLTRMVVPTIEDSRVLGAMLLCMGEMDSVNTSAKNGARRLALDMLAMREAMEREQTEPGTGIAYVTTK